MISPKRLILVLLAAVSVGRLWLERDLTADLRRADLLPPKLDLSVRDEMSQEAFAAALGGMRALLASYYELEAFAEFSKQPSNWHKVDQYYALCTRMQPMDENYWINHAWMLYANMGEDYGSEGAAPKGLEPELRAQYRAKGERILQKGLDFLPDSFALNRSLADFYGNANKVINPNPNHAGAAEYYLRASKCQGALSWMVRFHALQLSQVPGREREGYDLLRSQYAASEKNRYPSAITRMKILEEKLNIPYPMRIPETKPKPKRPTTFSLDVGN